MTKKPRVDNPEIIPFALHELGGAGQFIDVEDIFLCCFEVAPERFRWRKHLIANYKTLSKALRDFEGRHPDLLLKTEDGLSRQLSKEGIDWVKARLDLFREVLSQPGANPPTRRREQKLLNEFASHRVVRAFEKGSLEGLHKYEIADLLLCAPDSPTAVWKERLETYRSAATAAGRPKVECEYIDHLAREYDNMLESRKPLDPANPLPIISRRRDGLNSNHPFFVALKQAVEGPLGLRVAEEAERARSEARSVESDDTRQALNRLARELGRLVTEELREIEAEDLPGDDSGEAPLLSIVPEQVFAYMSEDRTLTVVARKDGVAVGDEVHVEVDPGGVVELLTPTALLKTHARREDVLVAQVRVRPLIVGEATMITATIGPRTAHALLEVQPPRIIVEEPMVPPETLQFERPTYRIGWQRQKELTLLAPAEVVAAVGEDIQISSTDPGIVVRTPQVRLMYDDNLDFYRATVTVEGRVLDAAGQVLARKDTLVAATQVKVTRKEEGPDFRIELSQEEMGPYRATIERTQDVQVVKVAARHPALLPYLGHSFEGQNSPIVRALVSEAVADAGARLVVSKLYYQRRNTEAFDVDRYYREHYKRMLKFLPRFQMVLVGDPAAARTDALLAPTELMTPQSVSA